MPLNQMSKDVKIREPIHFIVHRGTYTGIGGNNDIEVKIGSDVVLNEETEAGKTEKIYILINREVSG